MIGIWTCWRILLNLPFSFKWPLEKGIELVKIYLNNPQKYTTSLLQMDEVPPSWYFETIPYLASRLEQSDLNTNAIRENDHENFFIIFMKNSLEISIPVNVTSRTNSKRAINKRRAINKVFQRWIKCDITYLKVLYHLSKDHDSSFHVVSCGQCRYLHVFHR